MQYRREVDGLRALAVLPVILFHAELSAFRGGFVGVDVFFVISGYLITANILQQGPRFSLAQFYERRARRLLPALFAVMLVCLVPAWLWMMPELLENFGQSVVATVLFSNNVLLWHTVGYFSIEGRYRPLLHSWSLGVEEQFYLLFPLLVMLCLRDGRARLAGVMLGLALVSFTAAEVLTSVQPVAAFFMLPFRAWELLAGGLCALIPAYRFPNAISEAAGVGAIALMGLAIFTFGHDTPAPGAYMLVPVIATVLIIVFVTPQTLTGRLLSSRPLVGIGLISYSAYLWHQPIFAFARLRSIAPESEGRQLLLALLALAIAYPSWRFIEQPFRHGFPRRAFLWLVGVVAVLLIAVGLLFHLRAGEMGRMANESFAVSGGPREVNMAFVQEPFRFEDRAFRDPGRRNIMVVGDSFARDFINSAQANGYLRDAEISYSDEFPRCLKSSADFPAGLRARLAQAEVLIFGSPAIDLNCWRHDFELIRAVGPDRIVVIGPKNFGWNLNAALLLSPADRLRYRTEVLPETVQLNDQLRAALPSELFVDLLGIIDDADGRVPLYTEEGKLISWDQIHLTRAGAEWVGSRLFEDPALRDLK